VYTLFVEPGEPVGDFGVRVDVVQHSKGDLDVQRFSRCCSRPSGEQSQHIVTPTHGRLFGLPPGSRDREKYRAWVQMGPTA